MLVGQRDWIKLQYSKIKSFWCQGIFYEFKLQEFENEKFVNEFKDNNENRADDPEKRFFTKWILKPCAALRPCRQREKNFVCSFLIISTFSFLPIRLRFRVIIRRASLVNENKISTNLTTLRPSIRP